MMGGAFPLYTPPGFERDDATTVSNTLPRSSLQIYLDTLAHHLKVPLAQLPEPTTHALHTHYDCIPTYAPGHGTRMRELRAATRADGEEGVWDGRLWIVGTVTHPSLVSCINSARVAAVEVAAGRKHKGLGLGVVADGAGGGVLPVKAKT